MNRLWKRALWLAAIGLSLVGHLSCSNALADDDKEPPPGWIAAGSAPSDFEMVADARVVHSGKESAHIKSLRKADGFGTLMERFDPAAYRGKRIRLSMFVKAADVKDWAGVWMRVDGPETGKSLAFDNMQKRAIRGTQDWARYEVVLDVPNEATAIAFGLLLSGEGEVWMDDSAFEVVDDSVPTTDLMKPKAIAKEPLNLDFER